MKQGDMTEQFLTFSISNIGEGEWIGEESLTVDYTVISRHSVRTVQPTLVLEISYQELKRQLNSIQIA